MTQEQAIMPKEAKPISAVFVRDHIERFHARLVAEAQERVTHYSNLQTEYTAGFERAAAAGLEEQAHSYRIRIVRNAREVTRAQKILDILEAGFVPMPRLPAVRLEYVLGLIPIDILEALEEAKATGLFEEFRVIDGRDTSTYGYPRATAKPKGRDPILVGMVGDQMFPLAWWR